MSSGKDTLPTIPEAQATGEIAELYADMRAVMRNPVVNLIWRHVATLPGALAWGWGTLRPLYASGAVDAAAGRLVGGMALPALPRLTPAVLAGVGVSSEDTITVRRVLDTYHRANPLNLVALSALLARLEGRDAAGGSKPAGAMPHAEQAHGPPEPLPPMLEPDAMEPTAAALVWELAALGVEGEPGEMPSVWRNLAHWPGYLALAVALLRPLETSGWLAEAMNGLRGRRDMEAQGLPLAATPTTAIGPDARAALAAVLHRFTDGLIVRMIPLLAVLRATMPPRA